MRSGACLRPLSARPVARSINFGPNPPVFSTPKDAGTNVFDGLLQQFFPGSRVAARANTEGHLFALVRAGVGVCGLDCFVGDSDPLLQRLLPEIFFYEDLWAMTHVDMHRTPRVQAVLAFLADCLADEANLIEGRRPQPWATAPDH